MLTDEEMNALIDNYQKVLDTRAENLTYDECCSLIDTYRRGMRSSYYKKRHLLDFEAAAYLINKSNHWCLVDYRNKPDRWLRDIPRES